MPTRHLTLPEGVHRPPHPPCPPLCMVFVVQVIQQHCSNGFEQIRDELDAQQMVAQGTLDALEKNARNIGRLTHYYMLMVTFPRGRLALSRPSYHKMNRWTLDLG